MSRTKFPNAKLEKDTLKEAKLSNISSVEFINAETTYCRTLKCQNDKLSNFKMPKWQIVELWNDETTHCRTWKWPKDTLSNFKMSNFIWTFLFLVKKIFFQTV
jgi:hypothetical protein